MLRDLAVRFNTAEAHMARHDHPYASCYCEENVWHLAGDPRIPGQSRWVVFISNRDRCCLVWAQRSASSSSDPVPWDYHVILLVEDPTRGVLVYDHDTVLPFPTALETYLRAAFPIHDQIEERVRPRFRVLDAGDFKQTFASDRSHMRNGDTWMAPPPAWPCIRTETETMNLDRFIDMEQSSPGEVLDLAELRARFLRPR